MSLSRHTHQLLHLEDIRSSSFQAIPPPTEWTPAWVDHFHTMHADQYRYFLYTCYTTVRDLLGLQGDEGTKAELVDEIGRAHV